MTRYICHIWSDTAINWNLADWKWSECQLVQEIIYGAPGEQVLPSWLQEPYDPYNRQHQEKRKRFVEMIAKVKNEPEFKSKREINENVKISVKDIEMVVKKVSGIDIKILGD